MTVRVLIVDDEPDLRLLLRFQLETAGFEVVEASDGLMALEKAADADLIVLDIRMPGIDGFEVMRRLPDGHAPVIALSAHGRSVGANAALEAGCALYFTKPYDANELADAIRELVVPATG